MAYYFLKESPLPFRFQNQKGPTLQDFSKQLTIDSKTAANLIEVSPRRLRQLAEEGWIERGSRNKWSVFAVVQGYIRFLKDEASRSSKSASASRATDARTKEIELRIARQEGKFISIEDHDDMFEEVAGDFLISLSSLPARITRNPRERIRIEQIIDAERRRLSAEFKKKSDACQPKA